MQNLEQQLNDIECIIESQNSETKINVQSKPNIVYEIEYNQELNIPEGFGIVENNTQSVTVERE